MAQKRWTEKEIERLCFLKNQGYYYKQIAEILNRTESACKTMYHNCRCGVDKVSMKLRDQEIKRWRI